MAYCQPAENIINGEGEPSWIQLQLDTHRAHCELCKLIEIAAQHDGVLPLATIQTLGLTPTRIPKNTWTSSPSQLVVEYEGQKLVVQE